MIKLIKNIFAVSLISFAAFGLIQKKIVQSIEISIKRPSEDVIEKVSPISQIVKNKTDRVQLAVFNKQFAERVVNYNTDLQQLNDLYTLAGEYYFENKLKGKYEDLANKISNLIASVTTDDNHILLEEEKKKLSEIFMGLTWLLSK
jgi:hypothetical protein